LGGFKKFKKDRQNAMVNLNSAENARLYNTNINQIGQVLKFKKTRQNAMVNLHSAENAHFKL
jgi:hypothetical protein